MKLSGSQFKQFQQALLSAFPRREALAQMVRFGLDENLITIAGDGLLGEVAFNLITWAEANGKIADLLAAALSANPNNPELKTFAAGAGMGMPAGQIGNGSASPILPPQVAPTANLRQTMTERLSLEEVKDACYDLGIDYENLDGDTKAGKVRELIDYLRRRDRLGDLVGYLERTRPEIPWSSLPR